MKKAWYYFVGGLTAVCLVGMATYTVDLKSRRERTNVRYTSQCQAIEVTDTGMLMIDTYGETWYYEYEDGDKIREAGERFTVTFDTNATATVFDDTIISIR